MTAPVDKALAIFAERIDGDEPPGAWHTVDQEQIDRFADVCLDRSFIHVDPERAARDSPYGTTVAHGFLTLSLLSHLTASIPKGEPNPFEGSVTAINYGFDRVRWPAPVRAGSRVRARRTLAAAERTGRHGVQLTYRVTVDVDGETKPACAAIWLVRVLYQ